MYGIEYSTLANLIKYDDNKDKLKKQLSRRNSIESYASSSTTGPILATPSQTTSYLTENLVTKLQNLKTCPLYLMPKSDTNTSTTFTSSSNLVTTTTTTTTTATTINLKQNKNYYTDDFILLSEFSEIEGPKPLLTIPTDGGTSFNKNEYSLHLMCVDFHSHVQHHNINQDSSLSSSIEDTRSSSPSSSKRNTNKFNLTKDTSIINYWDSSNCVAACVHHFNLYDLEARGFVRPFCLAYISYDRTKPVFYFEQIRNRFNEITDLLKKSNFNLFKFDLEQRCNDLRFTRDLFLKWYDTTETEERTQLAKEHRLDAKTSARLTASTINEKAKQLQLNAIDTLLKELEYVIEVINIELKLKNWNKLVKTNGIRTKNENDSISLNSNSQMNALPNNRTNRSFTYPLNNNNNNSSSSNKQGVQGPPASVKRLNSVNVVKNKKVNVNRGPVLFKNILVGNLTSLQNGADSFEIDGFSGGIDFQQLNQSSKFQQNKTMKRLHQLSSHTAKQAINEMRLMQLYFSTPYYLLKFRELATPVHNFNKNNIWSIMCGEIAIANFGTHIDTFNLNKNHLITMANNNNNNKQKSNKLTINHKSIIKNNNETTREQVEEETDEETLLYSSMANATTSKYDSIKTQFYSPVNNELARQWLNNQSSCDTTNDSDIEVLSKVTTKSEENNNYQTVWETAIEQYLECSTENEHEAEEDEEFHDNYDDETISNDYLETTSNNTEENEYDFVNSLMTSEYKPYNQYSLDHHQQSQQQQQQQQQKITTSTLSLSSSFTSPAIIYSAFNRCKYQANLTDKLIQIIEFNFEETLKQLLQQFHLIMPHLFYSLLKGRPVICVSRYCDDLAYLNAVTDCLSNFVPNSFDSLNDFIKLTNNTTKQQPKFTSSPCNNRLDSVDLNTNLLDDDNNNNSNNNINQTKKPQLKSIYERKPIKLNDLKYCKLFGLSLMISKDDSCCSLDCNNNLVNSGGDTLSVSSSTAANNKNKRSNSFYKHNHKHFHQSKSSDDDELLLKYIPITVRNYVSIFDLDKCTFIGPKYTGVHLKTSLTKAKQMKQDSIIYLYLLNNLVKYYVKIAFLYNYSIIFDYHYHGDDDDHHHQHESKSRASSFQHQHNNHSKRERIRRYFALYNNNENNNNDSKSNYYSTLSLTSISSLASSLMGSQDSQNKQLVPTNNNNNNNDSELLKIVVALVDLASKHSLVENNNSNKFEGLSSFDQTDFNIVNHILKSLQMKQLYLYDLAIKQKNKLKKEQQTNQETTNLAHTHETQFSLLVDFEELTIFNSKK